MDGRTMESAGYRMVKYRYMTYDELAATLRCSTARASALALSNGWNSHIDVIGRTRVSVPELFLASEVCFQRRGLDAESTFKADALHAYS